jgi:hypothetical protein
MFSVQKNSPDDFEHQDEWSGGNARALRNSRADTALLLCTVLYLVRVYVHLPSISQIRAS